MSTKKIKGTKFSAKKVPDYICRDCAIDMGGELSDNEAQIFNDYCPKCDEFRPVIASQVWVWPVI